MGAMECPNGRCYVVFGARARAAGEADGACLYSLVFTKPA